MDILKKFLYKLYIVITALLIIGSYPLNAMKRTYEWAPEQYQQDHKEEAFNIYMNLQLIENYPTLPLDVVKIISLNAYISRIIVELSHNLKTFRNNPEEVLLVIKRLQDTCGFNVAVQILNMGLLHARMLLIDIKEVFCDMNLIDFACEDENNLDCIKIIFAAAGDQVQALISAKDCLSGKPLFHKVIRSGCIKIVMMMLDAFGDKVQDLIDLKSMFNRTALDEAKFDRMSLDETKIGRNDPRQSGRYHKIDEVIRLLESYQSTNQ